MMKKLLCAWIALALLLSAACGLGESLFVDNRETDKIYPERLNLRAQPAKNGAILGLYYTGTEVNVLAVENEEYDKVEVGGMTGYMASSYLIPQDTKMDLSVLPAAILNFRYWRTAKCSGSRCSSCRNSRSTGLS